MATTKKTAAAKAPATKTAAKKTEAAFTAEERAAMKQHAEEVKAQRKKKPGADDEPAVLAAIAAMPQPDRGLAEQVHRIVRATAPELTCKTWYGFPAYCKDGQVLVFFQYASKFKSRYSTLGFNDVAALDDGTFWPAAFAVTAIGPKEEKAIAALVKKAVG
jgi:uncharacterized protein YdhG (YjbR/CyaY superfamily)